MVGFYTGDLFIPIDLSVETSIRKSKMAPINLTSIFSTKTIETTFRNLGEKLMRFPCKMAAKKPLQIK